MRLLHASRFDSASRLRSAIVFVVAALPPIQHGQVAASDDLKHVPRLANVRSAPAKYSQDSLAICDGAPGWPPFIYVTKDHSKADAETDVAGFSVEVLKNILKTADIPYKIDLLPWRRCLQEVERGKNYQMALQASLNQDRTSKYLVSRSYYRTSSHIFYLRQRFPDGMPIHRLSDLKNYRVCGLFGFNYEPYGLGHDDVDQASGSHANLIKRLRMGRCDLFIEQIEVMAGIDRLGMIAPAGGDIRHDPVPGVAPLEFHMLISRNLSSGGDLLELINSGVSNLEKTGQLEKLWIQHVLQKKMPRADPVQKQIQQSNATK
ncbi:substrate-binding periplasmic protein [Roseateles sp. BYS87W]|uniref:Substrate-binding periplasmic protein n=1 Tax=Pelomonas baiyunensis TaxID=3299026 RepID=A0ABW7H268_9BURK